ncbi:MAG: DUF3159 domain-containing protein [Acholeplasmataceae bacterium]
MATTKRQEIIEELRMVIKGKTLDAIIPPLAFVILNGFDLLVAILSAIGLSLLLVTIRLIQNRTRTYALFGLGGVIVASAFAYLAESATSYFLPEIVSSVALFLVALLSILFDRPIAAYLSHLTRGWPISWYRRKDVLPAYREVTYAWTILLFLRMVAQIVLYLEDDVTLLFWVNGLTGLPALIVVLILTYIYGIRRLSALKGPSVEEHEQGTLPPYAGQKRGF